LAGLGFLEGPGQACCVPGHRLCQMKTDAPPPGFKERLSIAQGLGVDQGAEAHRRLGPPASIFYPFLVNWLFFVAIVPIRDSTG
jgi:hypothetical protein